MALSTQDFNRFLQEASSYTGFGMKRYDELKALGATDKQIQEIAARAPIVGDAVAGMFSELTSWGAGEKANLSRVPPGFNWVEYVKSNPDLKAAGIDTAEEAKRHYALTGYQESRPNAPALLPGITDEMWKQAERDPYYAAQLHDPNLLNLLKNNPDEALKLRQQDRANRVGAIYSELENQYNNLVSVGQQQGKNLAYTGRSGDLPTIFNQQAQQLADSGVTSIANLRIKDGRLVDSATNKTVTNSNLGGQVAVDQDTGVQKWGDVFSGVKGGANYGIQELQDGSVLFFPAWEQTKSPIAQLGLGGLEDVIGPVLTIAGAYYGMPGLGAVGGAAAGAAAGNTVGQFLASGEVDWGQVALSAAVAGGASYLSGAGGAAGGAGDAASALADAEFIAADAAQLGQQGLSTAAIQQNLIASGVDPTIAASAANLASTGAGYSAILQDIQGFGADTGGLFTATPDDMSQFGGITTGGTGVGLTPEQLQAIQRGEIPGGTFAEQVENAKFILPSAGAAGSASGLMEGAGGVAKDTLSNIFGEGGVSGFLTNLAGAGIDYAALQQIGKEATSLGREAESRATAAGAAANVPFTPYTVTSGAGSTAFGTGPGGQPTATVTSSPEYQALRQQALGQAGTTLGAIDPANAAQNLFQRSEALAGPARQRETEQLLSSLGARGLLGMSQNLPTVGGTTAGVNPYLESILSAQRTAQARSALESTQFGTAEAQRQAALAQGLISTGQGIDTAAMGTLTQGANLGNLATTANQTSAANQLRATLAGQALRQQYEDIGLQARAQGLMGAAGAGRGLLGLPTQPGNTPSQNILGNIFSEIFK